MRCLINEYFQVEERKTLDSNDARTIILPNEILKNHGIKKITIKISTGENLDSVKHNCVGR